MEAVWSHWLDDTLSVEERDGTDYVSIAREALDRFIRENFTHGGAAPSDLRQHTASVSLDIDGEDAIVAPANAALISFVEAILSPLSHTTERIRVRLHAITLHQAMLSSPSPTLIERFHALVDLLGEVDNAALAVEIANTLILMGLYSMAKPWLDRAQTLSSFAYQLTGSMGKRTKYQKDARAQLIVQIMSDFKGDTQTSLIGAHALDLPSVVLDDDLLLERMSLQDGGEGGRLDAIHTAIILARADIVDAENVLDDIKTFEQLAYIDKSFDSPVWSVRLRSLVRRSLLESRNSNTSLRALAQLESIVARLTTTGDGDDADRERDLFLAQPVPIFTIKIALAKQMEDLGLASSALSIYTALDVWEPMMRLLVRLGRRAQAEQMLQARITSHAPTPRLLCILGDVTNDRRYYHDAWELSKQRYSRAPRTLGEIEFALDHWQECIDQMRMALKVNPMFPLAWFHMGYSALQIKDLPTAISAFSRAVNLRPDDPDSLNNLAACYLQTRQMPQAYQALKECVRQKRDDWKVWDNFLTASMGSGQLQSAATALDHLADLAVGRVDMAALAAFTHAVHKSIIPDCAESTFIQDRTIALLTKLAALVNDSPDLFRAAAEFHEALNQDDVAIAYRHQLCRALEAQPSWRQGKLEAMADLVTSLTQLVDVDPDSRQTRLLLGRVVALADKQLPLDLNGDQQQLVEAMRSLAQRTSNK